MASEFGLKTFLDSTLEQKIIKSWQARWLVLDGVGRLSKVTLFY
jgi:hypothetical protein